MGDHDSWTFSQVPVPYQNLRAKSKQYHIDWDCFLHWAPLHAQVFWILKKELYISTLIPVFWVCLCFSIKVAHFLSCLCRFPFSFSSCTLKVASAQNSFVCFCLRGTQVFRKEECPRRSTGENVKIAMENIRGWKWITQSLQMICQMLVFSVPKWELQSQGVLLVPDKVFECAAS